MCRAPEPQGTTSWAEIFGQDRERKQDFDEASRTYDAMVATYTRLGYALIELPRASVEERTAFVLRNIASGTVTQSPRRPEI